MTDLGKQVIPSSQIPASSLYKRTLESFMSEYPDEHMAELHFTHHQKRRIKNLVRLNLLVQLRGNSDEKSISMPSLNNKAGNASFEVVLPAATYSAKTPNGKHMKKGHAVMQGISERRE